MFSSVKRFFAPSFVFSWAEIKEVISSSVALARRSFWQFSRLFWWVWIVSIGMGIFYFKLIKEGNTTEPADMAIAWVENHGALGALSLLVFLVVATFVYLSQFLVVRTREGEQFGFSQITQCMRSHYQFFLIHPFLFLMYWVTSIIGDFYVFMFLESEGSWKSFRQSLWSGARLGIKLIPVRFAVFMLMGLTVFFPLFLMILLRIGVWFLAKTSLVLAWFVGVPLGISVVAAILWAIPRLLFLFACDAKRFVRKNQTAISCAIPFCEILSSGAEAFLQSFY